MSYIYRAYDLVIRSSLELPMLMRTDCASIDLVIEESPVSPLGLDHADVVKPLSQVNEESLWFDVPGIARFLVERGKRITYEPYQEASSDSIQSYLLGSCLSTIFYQKQQLVFRAFSVCVNDKSCAVFLGSCSEGKSTVAAMLNKKCYPLLSDDFCVITSDLMVMPGLSQLKLWRNTLPKIGVEQGSLKRVRSEIDKYVLPVEHCATNSPRTVTTMYLLTAHNINKVVLEEVSGFAKFNSLTNMSYRPQFVGKLIEKKTYMDLIVALSNKVRLVRVYHANSLGLNGLADALDQDLR